VALPDAHPDIPLNEENLKKAQGFAHKYMDEGDAFMLDEVFAFVSSFKSLNI